MTAGIGHNNPPPSFADAARDVDLVWTEAANWLDGAKITNQGEADSVGVLLGMARDARKKADGIRKTAVDPLNKEKARIQAQFTPLLKQCDQIAETAKAALSPWVVEQDKKLREAEAAARVEAELTRAESVAAHQDAVTLEQTANAEAAADAATKAEIVARVAAKAKAGAAGGKRRVGLRTVRSADITDLQAFLKWAWKQDRPALAEFAAAYAKNHINTPMDGVTVTDEKVAV